jgi:hypothetical protein
MSMWQLAAFVDALYDAGLYSQDNPPRAWELADALWLARYITPPVEVEIAPSAAEPSEEKVSSRSSQPASGTAPEETRPIRPEATEVEVHIRTPTPAKQEGQPLGSRPFRTPSPLLLSRPLEIGRALRPLLRRVASRNRCVVDEDATVHNFAELSLPLPVLHGAPER